MKRFLNLALSLLAVITLTACSDSDSGYQGEYITIGETEVSVGCDDTFYSIAINAKAAWSATVDNASTATWLRLVKNSGVGGSEKLTFEMDKNTKKEARQATITVKCQTDVKNITVIQSGTTVETMTEADVKDFDKYYKPEEFRSMDMFKSDSKWSWFRSKQSEHFFVFWEPGFGSDPNSQDVPAELRVDIDDLLVKAEQFYKTNIEKLNMCVTGQGKSQLDKYKMEIYLLYQTEWLATGSGYDNMIGALWVNPSTCQPVGSTIAHEIGHSFQYQTYCDNILQGKANDFKSGYRYGYEGSNGGCGFWEQCAQWQSFQDYPEQTINNYHYEVWMQNHHRHFEHEWMRYASYWLHYYWTEKHGNNTVGRIWNESKYPEDATQAYMRLFCGGNYDTVKKELFEYAQRCVTYDFADVRPYVGTAYDGYSTKLLKASNGYYQVAYAHCPSSTGFNVIPLEVPEAGSKVTVDLKGLAAGSSLANGDAGEQVDGDGKVVGTVSTYNNRGGGKEGWTYGFVALKSDGSRVYSDINYASVGDQQASFTVPAGTTRLWVVVQGAPKEYRQCPWDEKESTDDQWPYQIKVGGTSIKGYFDIDDSKDPTDISLTYELKCDASLGEYVQGTIDLQSNGDIKKLAQAFVMDATTLSSNTINIANGTTATPAEGKVALGLQEPSGTINYTYTANSGFYCKADGSQGSWGDSDPLWFEYDKNNFVITYGHFPGKTEAGKSYTIKPVLVYTKGGKQYKATITLKMTY